MVNRAEKQLTTPNCRTQHLPPSCYRSMSQRASTILNWWWNTVFWCSSIVLSAWLKWWFASFERFPIFWWSSILVCELLRSSASCSCWLFVFFVDRNRCAMCPLSISSHSVCDKWLQDHAVFKQYLLDCISLLKLRNGMPGAGKSTCIHLCRRFFHGLRPSEWVSYILMIQHSWMWALDRLRKLFLFIVCIPCWQEQMCNLSFEYFIQFIVWEMSWRPCCF